MNFLSLFSGIEAASVALFPIGFKCIALAENDKFPSKVLSYHYPDTKNLGDVTKFKNWPYYETDVIIGGSPCQSFSVAGLRKGLDDPRGNLMLTYLAIADRYLPRWLVWENVAGVLSSNKGRDFGTFVGALGQLGYGWAYRILDAQYFGVPQRRRRVFVVGYLGDWRRAAAVLFERHCLQGNPPPRREKGERVVSYAPSSIANYSEGVGTLRSNGGDLGGGSETLVMAHDPAATLQTTCNDYSRADDFNCVAFPAELSGTQCTASENISPCLSAKHAVCFQQNTRDEVRYMNGDGSIAGSLSAQPGMKQQNYLRQDMQVRRLTPIECERLQGFPDNYTRIPWRNKAPENCPDGPRYKALGNSMAVPVIKWIGERIKQVENIIENS